MLEKGEYGEFFPREFSPFAYNGSEADYIYPLTEEEIARLGARYQPPIDVDTAGVEILKSEEVPDSIDAVDDSILDKAILCEETGRPFRITSSELAFYRRNRLPLPTVNPYRRMRNSFIAIGNSRKYEGVCELCGTDIETIYLPDTGWRLYCDNCYRKEVN